MPEEFVEFAILNVVAHPHEPGTYRKLFEAASNRELRFWGNFNAAIREIREVDAEVFQTIMVVGVELDLSAPLIERESYLEVKPDDTDVRLSNRHLYDGRSFLLTFDEKTHQLYIETKNEFNKRLSPRRAQKFFTRLLGQGLLGDESPEVDVTVVPKDDALDELLGLQRLDRVEINLKRPNPSDLVDDEVQEALQELEEQGAKSQNVDIRRDSRSESLELNRANMIRARVAQYNGFVRAAGRSSDGLKVKGSTQEYPKIVRFIIDSAGTAAAVVLRLVATEREARNQKPLLE